jgi:predicted alpha/beta superfamily hydrolase
LETNLSLTLEWQNPIVLGLPSTVESRWTFYTPTNVKYKNFKAGSLLQVNSGKFNQFADFIEKELIPEVSQFYKTSFISKTIFGHS